MRKENFSRKDIKKMISKKLISKRDLKKMMKIISNDKKENKVTLKISDSCRGGDGLVELSYSSKDVSTQRPRSGQQNVAIANSESLSDRKKESEVNLEEQCLEADSSRRRKKSRKRNKSGSRHWTRSRSKSRRRERSQSRARSRNQSKNINKIRNRSNSNSGSRSKVQCTKKIEHKSQRMLDVETMENITEASNEVLHRTSSYRRKTHSRERSVCGEVVRDCSTGMEGRLQVRVENGLPLSQEMEERVRKGERGVRERLGPLMEGGDCSY